jgi:hypothetical protein
VSDIFLRRTLSGFEANDDAAKERMRRWPPGTVVKADVRVPRDNRSLRRYWALVGMVFDNSTRFPSREALHLYLKIRAGHATPIVVESTGEVLLLPDSIDYDTLDEDQFRDVWQRVCDVVAEDILPGITSEEWALEVQKLVGIAR